MVLVSSLLRRKKFLNRSLVKLCSIHCLLHWFPSCPRYTRTPDLGPSWTLREDPLYRELDHNQSTEDEYSAPVDILKDTEDILSGCLNQRIFIVFKQEKVNPASLQVSAERDTTEDPETRPYHTRQHP